MGRGLAERARARSRLGAGARAVRRGELRLRVAGIVSSLDHDGRVAYIPASALLRGRSGGALDDRGDRARPGASIGEVYEALTGIGAEPGVARTVRPRAVRRSSMCCRTILRAVAIVDGLVCLYALIQALALTVAGAPDDGRRAAGVRGGRGRGLEAAARGGARDRRSRPRSWACCSSGSCWARRCHGWPRTTRRCRWRRGRPRCRGADRARRWPALIAVAWVARGAARESVVEGLAG